MSHFSAEFTRKRKHNLRNIVHSDFCALGGPKSGTTIARVKPKNQWSTLLLGDNLKQAARDARRSQELTRKDYRKDFKGNRKTQARDQTKSFLDCGKRGGQNYNLPSQQWKAPFCKNNNNNNRNNTTQKIFSFHREEIPQLEECILNKQLTNLKVEFPSGKTKQHLCNWKHLTSDIEILKTFSGLPREFTDALVQIHLLNCSQQYQLVSDDEIEKFLQKNVITRCDHEEGEIISPIFLKKKPDGSFRLILHLKNVNKNIEKQHFKIETITSILKLVTPNMYY